MQYSFDCFILDGSSMDDALKVVTLAWGDIGGTILYLVSNHKNDCFNQLSNLGWIIVVLGEYFSYICNCQDTIYRLDSLVLVIFLFIYSVYGLPPNIYLWFWENNS